MKNGKRTEISEWYRGKRLLVTGGAGYLATNLIWLLKEVDCHIVRLDRPQAYFVDIRGRARIDDAMEDISTILDWSSFIGGRDVVFHFAAQTSVTVANADPEQDFRINVVPILRLLESCRKVGGGITVLLSGTVTEVGIPKRLPINETHRDEPLTIYDAHKLMAETYLKHYACLGTVGGAVLRLANVYGPGPRSSNADRGVLNMMIRKALANETLTVYGNGEWIRDYIHVEDVARAFLLAALHIDKLNARHFVIGCGTGHTLREAFSLVADRVALRTGVHVRVDSVEPTRPLSIIELRNFIGDSSAFSEATGWMPYYNLQDGLDQTIDYFVDK
jgi:nucleoside-diphosphate-sugar epimerase